jgi:hypothetical protein
MVDPTLRSRGRGGGGRPRRGGDRSSRRARAAARAGRPDGARRGLVGVLALLLFTATRTTGFAAESANPGTVRFAKGAASSFDRYTRADVVAAGLDADALLAPAGVLAVLRRAPVVVSAGLGLQGSVRDLHRLGDGRRASGLDPARRRRKPALHPVRPPGRYLSAVCGRHRQPGFSRRLDRGRAYDPRQGLRRSLRRRREHGSVAGRQRVGQRGGPARSPHGQR